MARYLIVANGDFLAKEIILAIAAGKTLIALDGAADKLRAMNITPAIILGDFDSVSDVSAYTDTTCTIIETPNQDHTDLAKAIQYCDVMGATSIEIICATGGRLDHHEATMRTLRQYHLPKRPLLLHTAEQTLRYAINETITIQGEIGDKCGVFPHPDGMFSSQGLLFEVENFSEMSVGNSLRESAASVSVTGGALIVMPSVFKT